MVTVSHEYIDDTDPSVVVFFTSQSRAPSFVVLAVRLFLLLVFVFYSLNFTAFRKSITY